MWHKQRRVVCDRPRGEWPFLLSKRGLSETTRRLTK